MTSEETLAIADHDTQGREDTETKRAPMFVEEKTIETVTVDGVDLVLRQEYRMPNGRTYVLRLLPIDGDEFVLYLEGRGGVPWFVIQGDGLIYELEHELIPNDGQWQGNDDGSIYADLTCKPCATPTATVLGLYSSFPATPDDGVPF